MLTARDFHGDIEWKTMKQDFDELMSYRKTLKGKPDVYDKAIIVMNQLFIDFYKTVLFHIEGKSSCDCRMCELKRQEHPQRMEMMKLKFEEKNNSR